MDVEQSAARSARGRRWLLVILVGAAALVVALRMALPLALEWWLPNLIRQETNLHARVENVDLWLLRGAIAIEGTAVAEREDAVSDPAAALLSLSRLYVDLDWAELLERRIHLQELALDGPRIRLEPLAEGGIDLGFLEGMPEPEPSVEPTTAEPWPVRIDALRLRDLRADVVESSSAAAPLGFTLTELSLEGLVFEDDSLSVEVFGIREPRLRVAREFAVAGAGGEAPGEAAAPPPAEAADGLRYRVGHVEFEHAGLTLVVDGRPLDVAMAFAADGVTLRGGAFPIQAHVDIEDGTVELEGRLGLVPLVFQGKLRWKDLPVPLAVLAANPAMVSWIRSCRTHGEVEIELAAEPGPGDEPASLRVQGHASTDDLELANPGDDEEVVLAWKQLSIELSEAVVPLAGDGSGPIRIALAKLQLLEPRVLYTTPADSLAALAGDPATQEEVPDEAPAGDAASAPVELSADLVEVADGDLRYADRAVGYQGRVRDLDVSLQGLRWPALALESARVTARPPKGKALSLSGSLAGRSGTLELELDQLALPPLNAFAEPAGYRLRSGTLSLRTELSSDGTVLQASNAIELHELGLDALDANAFRARFGMPLDLMVALLRDTDDKISLSVPLTVAVEGGATRVGLRSALQSALRQALVGAATSPLKVGGFALGAIGLRGEASETIASVPGEAALADGQQDQLAAAGTLLASRPALGLLLRGRSGPVDLPHLAEEILIERLSAGGNLPDLEGAGLLAPGRVADALRKRGRGEPGALDEQDQALLARYAATVEVPEARLAALAQRRAETVREVLLSEGVEADRLGLGETTASGAPGVLLELRSAR